MSEVGEPILRLAARGDLDGLVRIEEAFPEEDRFDRRTWRRLLDGNTIAHVAEYNGTLAGATVLLLRCGSRIARLYTLSVCPEMRGKGLARQLMLAGEKSAKDKGCDRMRLEARESNHRAILLYERSGYRVVARAANYYPNGETAVRMEKPLGMSPGETR